MTNSLTSKLRARLAFNRDNVRELAHFYAASKMASGRFDLSMSESALRLGYLDGRETQAESLRSIIEAMLSVVRAAREVPDAEHGELKDALAELEKVVSDE